ncbi:hypothetical protein CIHG_09297 [Coccidioides immitis H538.4]|uniref:Uncharacterized protein n=3 Tax=Coccidioides immitis TaxID=5501 RepID=A0A0J8RA51_COCIT|nr:hypothetical protein CIRG_05537 [Coccidioides immitis RMSCC 2394]KMU80713.1 hypothetical protein CISG_08777 [Coccidioides immitis RMSCC 3703]KMU91428.1 hypothetical protein CIHG_09297 [Coccidioides immitis H538.4]
MASSLQWEGGSAPGHKGQDEREREQESINHSRQLVKGGVEQVIEKAIKGRYFGLLDEELGRIERILPSFQRPQTWQNIQVYLMGNLRRYEELFGLEDDNDGFQKVRIKSNKAIKRWLKGKAPQPATSGRPIPELHDISLWEMTRSKRKRLYNHWHHQSSNELSS